MARPITLFTGQWADLPFEEVCRLASEWGYDGLEIACWGDHFEVDKALAEDGYVDRKRETARQAQPAGLRDLQPPGRPGGLRPPDRRAAPGHPAGRDLGRRRARGRTPAGRGGDEGHRPGRRQARREDGRRLHRLVDLAHRWRCSRRCRQSMIETRLPGLRRPVEPDPRRVRRGRRAVRARGAPERDRVRLLDHQAHAGGDRPPAGVRPELGPVALRLAGPRPGQLHPRLRRPDLPRRLQGREGPHRRRPARPAGAPTCPGPTCAAAGTSSPPATATCPGRTASGRSTRSATTARSRSSGRTPAWTAWSARPRRCSSSAGSRSTRRPPPSTPRSPASPDRRHAKGPAPVRRAALSTRARSVRGAGAARLRSGRASRWWRSSRAVASCRCPCSASRRAWTGRACPCPRSTRRVGLRLGDAGGLLHRRVVPHLLGLWRRSPRTSPGRHGRPGRSPPRDPPMNISFPRMAAPSVAGTRFPRARVVCPAGYLPIMPPRHAFMRAPGNLSRFRVAAGRGRVHPRPRA